MLKYHGHQSKQHAPFHIMPHLKVILCDSLMHFPFSRHYSCFSFPSAEEKLVVKKASSIIGSKWYESSELMIR